MTKRTFIIITVVVILGVLVFVRIMDHRLLQSNTSVPQNTNTESTQQNSTQNSNTTPPSSPAYQNDKYGFSIDVPAGYTKNENYVYQNLGPGKDIPGVSFTIPENIAAGTNLSKDSYISVERLANAKTCSANLFVD